MIVHIHQYKIGDYVQLNENAKNDLPTEYNNKEIGIIENLILNSLTFDYLVRFKKSSVKVKEKELNRLNKFSIGDKVKSKKYYHGFIGTITDIEYVNNDFGYGVIFDGFDAVTWFWENDLVCANHIENNAYCNAYKILEPYQRDDVYVIPKENINNIIQNILWSDIDK